MTDWKLAYHANCWGALGGNAVGVTSITQLSYRTFGEMDRAFSDIAAAGYEGTDRAAIVLALAAGSVIASHVNDSGFWLVGRFYEMDLKTTLKTWTVLETLISVMGFALAAVIFVAF